MSVKRKLIIVLIALGCVAGLFVLVGWLIFKSVIAPFLGIREPPPELRQARIITGADFLTKTVFYEPAGRRSWRDLFDTNKLKSRFDSIDDVVIGQLDGQEGQDIGLVGNFGLTILDTRGNFKERINYQFQKGTIKVGPFTSEREKNSFHTLRLIDIEGDGVCEILGYGGLDGMAVFDHQGKVLFSRGEYQRDKTSIREVAAGDLDGDGALEFIASWGYEPWEGLELFDRYGNSIWRHEEKFLPHDIEVVDTDLDGRPEIIERDGSKLIIRDARAKVIGESEMPVYLWRLFLCPRPDGQKAPQILAVREGNLWLIDLDGKNYSKFDAPLSQIKLEKPRELSVPGVDAPLVFDKEEVYRAKGVWVKLKKEEPKYLAVIASFTALDRALLYVYDEQGKLIYQEILPEECDAIVTLSSENDAGKEDILIGGEKTVWRYSTP